MSSFGVQQAARYVPNVLNQYCYCYHQKNCTDSLTTLSLNLSLLRLCLWPPLVLLLPGAPWVSLLYIFCIFFSASIIETYTPLPVVFSTPLIILRHNRIRLPLRCNQTAVIWGWRHCCDEGVGGNGINVSFSEISFLFHSFHYLLVSWLTLLS